MAKSIRSFTEEEKEKMIEEYKNNISLRQLQEKYGVSRSTLSKFLEEAGVKTTKGNHYRKYFHDEDFFEVIDTEEKAYWLGFMFADGYIVDHSKIHGQDAFGISLVENDTSTLEKFKKSINATNPITKDSSRKERKPMVRLLMSSQKTVDDLINKGCLKKKSLLLKPPIGVPDFLLLHFIRGLFDGDGHITYNIQYEKYLHPTFGITTTYEMAEWLKAVIGFGSIVREKRRENTYYFKSGGINATFDFYHLLYDNATIYMDRKYDKFQEIFKKYAEMRGK